MNYFEKRNKYFERKELRYFHCMSVRTSFDTTVTRDQYNKLSAMR